MDMPPPPAKKMRAITINNGEIPPEIFEEILLNLPVKSLLRFSSVSKSCYSTVFESGFIKRYRGRRRRERITFARNGRMTTGKASSCLISSISSKDTATVDATDFDCPFAARSDEFTILASCDDLWLARSVNNDNRKSRFLWNPSMRRYKQLPNPNSSNKSVLFGLGFECVGDDYKILRISCSRTTGEFEGELYSLRSDSWRNIEDLPSTISRNYGGCAFLGGKLHLNPDSYVAPPALTCFDLLTEKFGEVALPNYSPESRPNLIMRVSVTRGMLCVSINLKKCCDVWVMEEYGVAESWARKFRIPYINDNVPLCTRFLPLYLYDNREILIRYFEGRKKGMFVYNEDEKSRHEVKIGSGDNKIACRFVYVDSLVALDAMHELN